MTVLSLQAAKDHLNITEAKYNDELTAMIAAAEAIVAKRVGPLEPTPVTAQVVGGRGVLVLPVAPAIALTSLVAQGESVGVSLSGLALDPDGLLTSTTGRFAAGRYTVTYMAGRTTVPADLLLAVKETLRHLWSTQRGSGTRRPGTQSSDSLATSLPGAAYALPIRVEQLINPHLSTGFA